MDFSLSQEQRMFRETVYRYGRDEIAPLCEEADLKGEFSFEIWRKLASFGILGLPLPEEFGGSAASILNCCLAGEALGHAGVDGGSLLAWGAHTYLCAHNIYAFGTEDQKGSMSRSLHRANGSDAWASPSRAPDRMPPPFRPQR